MIEVLRHAIMIAGFVFVMMLVVEYLNILTSGAWRNRLAKSSWGQYLLASALGVLPGCLGAFAVVAMYSHRVLGIGAVVAAMIATSGDESFVMLAMYPQRALVIFGVLFVLGIAAGALVDMIVKRRNLGEALGCEGLEIHEEHRCSCFPSGEIVKQWRECSPARGILAVVLVAIIVAIVSGQIGPPEWNWIRQTLLVASAIALFIVATVHDHFLEEHLWEHIAKKHMPRIFLWTLGVLVIFHLLTEYLSIDLGDLAGKERFLLLTIACLVGLIPQSGPHMIFVTLFASGTISGSILLANSIVQDGHGMLPLLAYSRRAFFTIKIIKFIIGMAIGSALLLAGY
jgi:hypothetical protein